MAEQNIQVCVTDQEFKDIMAECRNIFAKKLHDYGASWRILRPTSLTDQLFIKAKRIRDLETTGKAMVNEGIRPEFLALVNYGIIGLLAKASFELMQKKNHDYGEAWRDMRVSSYTDFILTKIARIKELEDIDGKAIISEGIDANLYDIINYSVFGAIRLKENQA